MGKILLAAAAAALMLTAELRAGKVALEPLPEDLKALSKKGMEAIYAVDVPEARKLFTGALQRYPDHPIPSFGIAMAKWAEIEYLEEESVPGMDTEYEKLTDKAIETGVVWLKKHPGDANAYMVMGGMYGLRARLAVMKHSWIKAYFDGRKALSHTRKSLKLDPGLYDAYLGLGMYEYYAGTLKGVIKVLAKLLMNGSADKGLELMRLCREKGYFNAMAAELMLIEIYTKTNGRYHDSATAVKWAGELRRRYPVHPQMHFVQIVSLYEDRQYAESRKESLEYLKRLRDGVPAYRRAFLPRILTAVGATWQAEKNLDEALRYYGQASDVLKEDPSAHPSRWAVWALVKQGNAWDLKGDRAKAVRFYKEAKSYKDEWGFHEYIDRYIKKPFTEKDLPGELPPP